MSSTNTPANLNVRRDKAVLTSDAPAPLPVFSQAIKTDGLIFVSGNVGIHPETNELVEGVKGQTVRTPVLLVVY
jgi:enamine deaminase RidA (YjgF/YER057c/UK114 family)